MSEKGLLFDTVKKTLRHSFIYGIGTSFAAVVGVILIPLYTRRLAPSEYGVYSLISIVFTLLVFVYDFGMINALFRWVYQHREEEVAFRKRVASTALVSLAALSAVLTFMLWNCAAPMSFVIFKNSDYAWLIRLMLVSVFLQSLTWVPLSLLRIREKPMTLVAIVMSGMAVMVLFNLIFLSRGMGLEGIYKAYIISYTFMLIPLFYVTRSYYAPRFSFNELKGMLKFGLPFLPVMFFSWVIDFSGRYFLGRYSTLQQVGLYSIGFKIGQVLYMVEKTFVIAWAPLVLSLAERYAEKAPQVFGRVFTYFIFASALLFLIISVFSKEIIRIFTSPPYYDAFRVVPLIALSYLLYGVYAYMLSGLIITKNVYVQPFIFTISAIVNIALNVILIPRLEMMGAAYAAFIAYFIIAFATYRFSQACYPIPVEFSRISKIFLSSALIYLLVALTDISNLAASFTYKGALLVVFFYILYITGFFQRAEIDKLKLIILRRKGI